MIFYQVISSLSYITLTNSQPISTMTLHKYVLFFIICQLPNLLFGQGAAVPIGNEAYHMIDRLAIKTGEKTPFFNTLRPFRRGDLTAFAIHVDTTAENLSSKDKFDLSYIFRDNNEWLNQTELPTTIAGKREPLYRKVYVDSTQTFYTIEETPQEATIQSSRYVKREKPILKYFYKTPANLFQINEKYFHLRLNPILDIRYGRDENIDDPIFFNRRGVEVRAGIDDRVYFYSNILETQARFPEYVRQKIISDKAVPGAGFYKNYSSDVFNIEKGQDYLLSQGYLAFNASPHIGVQFGHGQNFIGNGYRSLFLSDFSNNYFYLKLNTRVWKLHYQNIFAELNAESIRGNPGNTILDKKYLTAHYLTYRPIPTLRFGIYEAVIYHRTNQFELQYLNPVILYRTVEQGLDSPDNAFIGLDFSWDIFKRFQVYSQLMLDEFLFDELLSERRGWWANKYGIQLGIKYIDALGIDHLDIQAEFNTVRPYTYQHRDSSSNYSHTAQSLAHPLGANFKEFLLRVRYPILDRLLLKGRVVFAEFGEDQDGVNYGGNLIYSYNNRFSTYGNKTGQGVTAKTFLLGVDLSYQLHHNLFIDLSYFYRNKDSEEDRLDRVDNYFQGGIRMNIGRRNLDF